MNNRNSKLGRRRSAGLFLTAALAAVAVMAASGTDAAHAQGDAAQASPQRSEIDHSTSQWLALQRSNTAAAPEQPMLGDEAGLAYKRYLASFNSKIPDFFSSAVGQTSGAGSQGGTLPQN
jgi:hypothetical protein